MVYVTTCLLLYYILNIMAQGAVAFLYIVFLPLIGISVSMKNWIITIDFKYYAFYRTRKN